MSPILSGNKISTGSPYLVVGDPAPGVVFDNNAPIAEQYLLVNELWQTHDANHKLLATEAEHALVLFAQLPLQKYEDAVTSLPLFYIFTYDKSTINSEKDYAFMYRRLLQFTELDQYKVYEDDQYVCYEVSDMVYSNLAEYTQGFVSQNADIRFDAQVWLRIENIYTYYKENLGNLFYYK